MADVEKRRQQARDDQLQLMLHGSPADGGSGGSSPGLLAQVADTVADDRPLYDEQDQLVNPINVQPVAYDPISYNPVQGGGQNPQILPYPYPYDYGFGALPVGNYQPPNLFAQLPPPVTQGIGSLGGII